MLGIQASGFVLLSWLFSNQSIMIMRSDNYTVLSFFVFFFSLYDQTAVNLA